MAETQLKPRTPIRRFDVFAEYNRQKAIEDGIAPDEAEGYGLWLAKVVASRGFGRSTLSQPPSKIRDTAPRDSEEEENEGAGSRWRTLNGKPQTDELFHTEIVRRMGSEFYEKIFVPAISEAMQSGKSYTAIRDTIRREWKP